MTSPARTETTSRRLRAWLQRHDRALGKRAVGDIEETEALHDGARHGAVSMTQLRALLNTAKMCSIESSTDQGLREYIRKRKERRADADESESAFWGAVNRVLGDLLDEVAPEAVEACEAPETTPETRRSNVFDHRAVRTLVARRYLSHFVAHCQYLQRL